MKNALSPKEIQRFYGEHFTPIELFNKYIFPWIMNILNDYIWVDFFAGEGNLILPILDYIDDKRKIDFFKNNIYMFEIQKENYDKLLLNTIKKGIPKEIAQKNIFLQDTIENYPDNFLKRLGKPVFHITNPPYLYLGYIVKNRERFANNFKYFNNKKNKGYQDLYQLALINDLRNKLKKMIYIIPSNFLFGSSVSNKIRKDFFNYFYVENALIFEKEVFEFTGTNVIVCNFTRKKFADRKDITFSGLKFNNKIIERKYILRYRNSYRAGSEFDEFVDKYSQTQKIKFSFYLEEKILENGNREVELLDANDFRNHQYSKIRRKVSEETRRCILNNILFIRTVDTGGPDGRAGLYNIRKVFDCDGILVTKNKYRTHPIQILFNRDVSIVEQEYIKRYFNLILEHLRKISDSEFLTTYKYSNSVYIRKYLGLSQTKKILGTYPFYLPVEEKKRFLLLIKEKKAEQLLNFLMTKSQIMSKQLVFL